jgi:hypothetical protein
MSLERTPPLSPWAGYERSPRAELTDRLSAIRDLADHAVTGALDPTTAIAGIRDLLVAAETWAKAAA